MSKPEIPQDIFATARTLADEVTFGGYAPNALRIARALMSAEQRGAEKERELCEVAACDQTKIYGRSGTPGELVAYIQGRSDARAAIRARSNSHD